MQSDFFHEEDLKASLVNFEKALELNELKYFEVHEFEFIIDHYLSLNDIKSTGKAIETALKIHPNNHEVLKRNAQFLNMEGAFDKAEKEIQKAFSSYGTTQDVDYYLISGEALLGLRKLEDAHKAFSKALELAADDYFEIATTVAAIYQQEGFNRKAVDYLKMVVDEDSSLLFDIALSYQSDLDFEASIEYFEKFLPIAPFSVDAWYALSKSYQSLSHYAEAEDAILNAIAIDPDTILYQYDLARIYVDQHEYIKALEIYKEILKSDKKVDHTIFMSIGDISFQLMQFENAKRNYELVLRIEPQNSEALHALGQVAEATKDYIVAKEYYEKAIKGNQPRVDYQVSLANLYRLLGDHQKAEAAFVKIANDNSDFEYYWSLLVDFYFYIGKTEEALSTIRKVYDLVGDNYQNNCKIAAFHIKLGRVEKGLDLLKKLIEENSDSLSFFESYYPNAVEIEKVFQFLRIQKK